ncbi:M24 family metallopeptidase [Calderihabitans maritimus]|nr:Xaa-Pro peptidase family protein [Calderihabitans maritimus]
MTRDRLERLRENFEAQEIEAMLVMQPENRRYLSGFTGTFGVLVIGFQEAYLITDFRYVEQAEKQASEFKVVKYGNSIYETLSEVLKKLDVNKVGFEAEHVTYAQFVNLRDKLDFVTLKPVEGLIERLRQFKDEGEIDLIRRAVVIADKAFEHILSYLRPGVKEKEIALELEFFMRRNGAEKAAFDIIVASGPRGSLPHGVASDRQVQPGDLIVMDFGAVYQGYHSDITRTVVVGEPDERQKEIYNIVLEAQVAAIKAIKPGKVTSEIDLVARNIIAGYGYGEHFGHGLGHGVGLAVHERPRLASTDFTQLETGMVMTVEPGIYVKDWGGVRIEDMVVVRENGCEVLTGATKKLLTI